MTMAAAKKTKRPFAIWLSQLTLVYYLALLAIGVGISIGTDMAAGVPFSESISVDPSNVVMDALFVLALVLPVPAFFGLCFRIGLSRWLSIGYFVFLFVMFLLTLLTDEELTSEQTLAEPGGIPVLIIIMVLLFVPAPIATVLLIFSPKAKRFFSPELESGDEMNHLPPPPPEFD